MIREQDVREAIAEMQGERNPNANTCIKLAAYYTILDHITESPVKEERPMDYEPHLYSGTDPEKIDYEGESDFADAINGKSQSEVWPVIDELMTTLQVIHPRLYTGVMAKIR